MTIKNTIIDLLKNKELTSIEISSELQIPKKNLWVYLKTLVDEGKIERTTDKKPYKYRAIKTYDENMNNRLLHDKIDKLEKTISNLREMFENGVLKVYRDKMNDIYVKILEEL